MKKIIALVALSITFVSCDKSVENVEVVRDCTGTYIRYSNGTDDKVCNASILDPYNTGDKVKVKSDNLEQCFGLITPGTCMMAHPFNNYVEITEIQ